MTWSMPFHSFFMVLGIGILAPFPSAAAELGDPLCADENTANMPRVTKAKNGMPLSLPVRIIHQGEAYDMPIGYMGAASSAGWIKERMRDDGSILSNGVFGFAFWMPSLRYVEGRRPSLWLQPCEYGRPKPNSHEFLVSVRLEPMQIVNGEPLTPYKRFLNITHNRKDSLRFSEEYELIRYESTGVKTPSINYSHHPDSPIQLDLRCITVSLSAPNPSCSGFVLDQQRSLYYWIKLYRYGIKDWQKIIDGVSNLLDQWRDPHKFTNREKQDER